MSSKHYFQSFWYIRGQSKTCDVADILAVFWHFLLGFILLYPRNHGKQVRNHTFRIRILKKVSSKIINITTNDYSLIWMVYHRKRATNVTRVSWGSIELLLFPMLLDEKQQMHVRHILLNVIFCTIHTNETNSFVPQKLRYCQLKMM